MAVKKTAKVAKPAPALSRGTTLTIAFGLVNVAVGMKPATGDGDKVKGTWLCAEHGSPVKMPRTCSSHGEVCETVTAYKQDDGSFVTLDESVLDSIALEGDRRLELTDYVDASDVDPVYFDNTYLLYPQVGHEEAFKTLSAALRADGRVAMGTTVLYKTTRRVALRWSEPIGALVAETCNFDANVRWNDVAKVRDAAAAWGEADPQMVELAQMLLGKLNDEFDPADFVDEYNMALRDAIATAARGEKVEAKPAPVEPAPVNDVMAALRASVEAAAPAKPKRNGSRKKVAA